MSAYVIANFSLINPAGYKAYVAAVLPTIQAHGGEILVADYESQAIEGDPGSVTVVIRFASSEVVDGWYRSPEYQEIIQLRTDNTRGVVIAAREFDMERNLRFLGSL